jgi:YHS domain-containing protein
MMSAGGIGTTKACKETIKDVTIHRSMIRAGNTKPGPKCGGPDGKGIKTQVRPKNREMKGEQVSKRCVRFLKAKHIVIGGLESVMKIKNRSKTTCPVCMMQVETHSCPATLRWEGKERFFCSETCRENFLEAKSSCWEKKGSWGRWLEKVARSNEKLFGKKGPCCH